jgi:hypothetical protein
MGLSLLIFTPTWVDPATGEEAIKPEVEAAIKGQIGVDFDWHVTTDNPYPIGDYRNVLHQYQQARDWFLRSHAHGGQPYDALLTIEHDNVLPDPEAAQRLADTPGDVIYAPYKLRHGSKCLNTWQYINDHNLGMSLTNYPRELRRARQENIHRVSGAGFGCTLIRRHVVEAIEFTGQTPRDKNWCPDLRFAEDCLRRQFVANGRFDVPVLHWDETRWVHPFEDRRNRVAKYLALESMNAMAAGRFVRLAQGAEIELTDEEAAELARIGAVEAVPIETVQALSVRAPSVQTGEMAIATPIAEVEIVSPARRRRAVKAQ